MPSLRELLASHAPLLVLDAASTRVQVGLFETNGKATWQTTEEEAGVALFRSLETLAVDLAAVRAFAFCEGPGSILGVRTTAMAIRTWQALAPRPAFAYCSLAAVSCSLGQNDLGVIADARRDSWHQYRPTEGLRRLPAAELAGKLVMPEGFRHWSPLPAHAGRTSYALNELLPRTAEADLFRATDHPDAFLHEEPSYATWTPQIHRAQAPTS